MDLRRRQYIYGAGTALVDYVLGKDGGLGGGGIVYDSGPRFDFYSPV